LFTAGKVAMTLDGSWQQDTYTSQGGSKLHWGVAVPPVPAGKSFRGTLGGWNMVIFKQTPHPDAAWKLVQYLGEKAPQIAVNAIAPARVDAANVFLHTKRTGAPVLLQTLTSALPRDLSPIYPQISTIEQTMVQNIFTGMDAQKAANKAASDMDSAISSQ
jgi:multiple sugar transport system substrate-binding protein